jgi:hypothetical protein
MREGRIESKHNCGMRVVTCGLHSGGKGFVYVWGEVRCSGQCSTAGGTKAAVMATFSRTIDATAVAIFIGSCQSDCGGLSWCAVNVDGNTLQGIGVLNGHLSCMWVCKWNETVGEQSSCTMKPLRFKPKPCVTWHGASCMHVRSRCYAAAPCPISTIPSSRPYTPCPPPCPSFTHETHRPHLQQVKLLQTQPAGSGGAARKRSTQHTCWR